MDGAADVLNAVTGLAWPLIAGLVLWRLLPSIKKIVESRGFTVKIGQAELTVQEVSEKVLAATADIQGYLAVVTSPIDRSSEIMATSSAHLLKRVLWVDDTPSNNAYEVAQLETLGVEVLRARSTNEALAVLSRTALPFDAIISDLGRDERSGFNPNAGIDIIHELRRRSHQEPVYIYSSRRALARREEIFAAGGKGVTSSPTELFALLREVGPFPASQDA